MAVTAYLVGGTAAVCIPVLHHFGRLDFPSLVGLMVAATVLDVPGVAAVTGLVPGLAEAAQMPLERGNALLGGVHQVAQMCGVPLGGLATACLGTGGVLVLDAVGCLLAAVVILVAVPAPKALPSAGSTVAPEAGGAVAGTGAVRTYLADIGIGLGALWRNRLLCALASSGTAFNALDSGLAGVVLVVYAYQELGSSTSLAVLLTAFGAGMLAGSAGYAAVGHRFGRRSVYLVCGLGVGLLIAPLAVLPPLPVSAVLMALLGAVAAPVGPVRVSALQRGVPGVLYGRVVSAVDAVGMAAVPLGASAAVLAVEVMGLRAAILAIAALYLTVVAACWRSVGLRGI
jgi:predicted MFS family arabinose efflux permease